MMKMVDGMSGMGGRKVGKNCAGRRLGCGLQSNLHQTRSFLAQQAAWQPAKTT